MGWAIANLAVLVLFVFVVLIGLVDALWRLLGFEEPGEKERQEEERRRNSPEEIERRRREAEERERELEVAEEQRKIGEERKARRRWQKYHRHKRIEEVDTLSGLEFERFVATLLKKLGYGEVLITPRGGDQGGDVECVTPDGVKAVVQAKRWKGAVGNTAIQELLGAMLFYDAQVGVVVTNSEFTYAARQLAAMDKRIQLWDRRTLAKVTVHALGSNEGAGWPARWASTAAVR